MGRARTKATRTGILITPALFAAAAAIAVIGTRYANVVRNERRIKGEDLVREEMRKDAALTGPAFARVIESMRAVNEPKAPFPCAFVLAAFKTNPPRAAAGAVFRAAEKIEFTSEAKEAARRKYEEILGGRLDPTDRVIGWRNVSRLYAEAGRDDDAARAIRNAVAVVDADDEERLRAAFEETLRTRTGSETFVRAVEAGDFAAADPRLRVFLLERVGGDLRRVEGLRALAALMSTEDPDGVAALDDETWTWRVSTADGRTRLAVAKAMDILGAIVPGVADGRVAARTATGVRLPAPFPATAIGIGPVSAAEIDDEAARAAGARLFGAAAAAAVLVTIGAAYFVTERRRAAFERRRDDFTMAVTHEMKTPLANIMLYADTIALAAADDAEGARRFSKIIRDEAARLLEMIKRSLEVASGRASGTLAQRRFDAAARLEAVLLPIRALAEADGIAVLAAIERIEMTGTEELFTRTATVLIENALDHARSEIRVALERTPRGIAVIIDDDGPGVLAEDADRIFEPYVRILNTPRRRPGGVGLGLVLARECAGADGGTVLCERSPLSGARFIAEYPERKA